MRRKPTLALSLAGVVVAAGCGGNGSNGGAGVLPRQTANADGISPIVSETDITPPSSAAGTAGVLSSSIVLPVPSQRVTQAVVHRNTADETVLTAQLTDGSILDYLCTRDPGGFPNRLVSIRRYVPGIAGADEVRYDSNGLPSCIALSDGTMVTIERFESGDVRLTVATPTASSTTTFTASSVGPITYVPGMDWPFGKEVWPEFYRPVTPEEIENPSLQFMAKNDPGNLHLTAPPGLLLNGSAAAINSTTAVALRIADAAPVSSAMCVSANWAQGSGASSAIAFEPSPNDSTVWVAYVPVALVVQDPDDRWQVLPIARLLQKACLASASMQGTPVGPTVNGYYQILRASGARFAEVTNGTLLMSALNNALDLADLTCMLDVANSDFLRALIVASNGHVASQTVATSLDIVVAGFTGDGLAARRLIHVETPVGIPSFVTIGATGATAPGPALGLYTGSYTLNDIPGSTFPIEIDIVSGSSVFVRTFDERLPEKVAGENIVLTEGGISFTTVPVNGIVYSFDLRTQGTDGLAGNIGVNSPTVDGSQNLAGTVSLVRQVPPASGQ